MSFKDGLRFTSDGLNLLAKVTGTAKELKFTRIGIGDGFFNGNILSATGLIAEKMSLPIVGIQTTENQTEVKCWLTNAELAAGFYFREKGLYALDPDSLEEKLYAYGYAGNDAEFIPPGSSAESISRYENILAIVDNAQNVTANITLSMGASEEDVEAIRVKLDDHIVSTLPHQFVHDGVTYKYGFGMTESGGIKMICEEVTA